MKIFHFNTERGWRGGERQTLLTAAGMQDSCEITIICQPDSPLQEHAEKLGLMVIPLKVKASWDIFAALKLRKLLIAHGVDILHMHTAHAVSVGVMASSGMQTVKRIATRRVDFKINSPGKYNRCARAIAISEAIKKVMIDSGVREEKIDLLHSAIDTGIKSEGYASEYSGQPLVGVIGHLADHKGHTFLIDAWPKVLQKFPKAHLLIVGDGELRNKLELQRNDAGLEKSITFTGFLEEVNAVISQLDLYVQPSRMEGLCTTLMDVLLHEIPIVATSAGGIPEVLQQGRYGLLVPPENSEELAQGIIKIAENDKFREQITTGAADYVKKQFSFESMVLKLLNIYQKVMAK